MSGRFFLASGLVLLLLAVMLGAFGAHAIRDTASGAQLTTWRTASLYHFIHALGLVSLGMWMEYGHRSRWLVVAGVLLLLGVLLFAGSLYALVLTSIGVLGMITPFGGVCFMLGWLLWFVQLITQPGETR